MEGSRLGNLVCRVLLIMFAAIVLGVSVTLAKQWDAYDKDCQLTNKPKVCRDEGGRWPASTDYSAFVGGFGLVDAFVGLVAVFITALPAVAVLVVDALAAIFYLAGGVNLAVLYAHQFDVKVFLGSRDVTRYQADIAFMFLGFIAVLAAMALHFMSGRSGKYNIGSV